MRGKGAPDPHRNRAGLSQKRKPPLSNMIRKKDKGKPFEKERGKSAFDITD